MITFSYNKEENIFYIERRDEIELDDLIKYIEGIDQYSKNMDNLYILDDIRNSISKFTIEDIPTIIDEVKKRISKYKEVRCAVLVDKPFDTALSMLYENLSSIIENYLYKTFSTTEAGKNWLKQGLYYRSGK